MELWKIGKSEPAPKFNIVVSPNEWSKSVKSSMLSSNKLTETKILQNPNLNLFNEIKELFCEVEIFISNKYYY